MAKLRKIINSWAFVLFIVASLWAFGGMIAADQFTLADCLFVFCNLVLAWRIVIELDGNDRVPIITAAQ